MTDLEQVKLRDDVHIRIIDIFAILKRHYNVEDSDFDSEFLIRVRNYMLAGMELEPAITACADGYLLGEDA